MIFGMCRPPLRVMLVANIAICIEMNPYPADRVHALWDELADFDAARIDEALDHLMASLCDLIHAQNANWFGAVRLADLLPGDPAHGWRPHGMRYLHPTKQAIQRSQELIKQLEQGCLDETAIRNIALAGSYRANRLVDLASSDWFDSAYYRTYYSGLGHVDVIWAGVPINEDAECYFGFFREAGHPWFTPEERDLVAYALRGLRWFYRRLMLSRGLMVASAPLTATEREVLGSLIGGLSEKQIAASRHQSPHTTHEYVSGIYRKFGVNNRAALMALWLGKSVKAIPPD